MRQARRGVPEARARLAMLHLGLAHHVARRFRSQGLEHEDVLQVACLGLVKAVDGYKPELGTAFSTYAVPVIVGELRSYLRGRSPVKLGRNGETAVARARRVRREMRASLGRDPTLREVAETVGLDPADLAALLEAAKPATSLPTAVRGTYPPLTHRITVSDCWEERALLRSAVDTLPEPERRVIQLRFYLDRTQRETAAILGISQPQVSRLERRALDMLRQRLA